MLPDDLLAEARARAAGEGLSLAELVRRGLEQLLGRSTQAVSAADPYLADQSTFSSAAGDLAESHDEYLYGKKRN